MYNHHSVTYQSKCNRQKKGSTKGLEKLQEQALEEAGECSIMGLTV